MCYDPGDEHDERPALAPATPTPPSTDAVAIPEPRETMTPGGGD